MESHNHELKDRIATYLSHLYENKMNEYLNIIVLDQFLWTATVVNNDNDVVKYKGQPYWSKKAIIHYQSINIKNKQKDFSGLRHEHIMPRKLIKEKILASNKSKEVILEILNKYSHAVIITKEEDQILKDMGFNQSMPESFNQTEEILDRYDGSGIEIIDVRNTNLKEIKFH
ncbi:hypothetical protein JHD46_02100 [Sulfurimonas sp. SAG-AH-194-C20]|nr:hypothetical protein [Sulfurimonas sp. SAG-AH-194-C20]MDF1878427.1 hypothetical protein [Sulfurimonas sp. SAG-AH-194-C20]